MDNRIQWIFEKIFDQLTADGTELLKSPVQPFENILVKTFNNSQVHQLISKLSGRSSELVVNYLTNLEFQEKFLFNKLRNKINVQILLGNLDKIIQLKKQGHQENGQTLELTVVNNRLNILQYFVTNWSLKLSNELLYYCAEFGHEDIYFWLRQQGLIPNASVYQRAAMGQSLSIIQDVNEQIAISEKILGTAFEANQTQIILYLIGEAQKIARFKFNKNWVADAITNNNMELVIELDRMKFIDWHVELYYASLLSGSMEMVRLVEKKIPNLHDNHILDTSKESKGKKTLLLEEIIYTIGSKKYFAHTMNYAIQSESLEIVQHVYAKGYGITVSNFITAIHQGTPETLNFLCCHYHKKLPFYLIHYLGLYSYATNKLAKAKILFDHDLIDLQPNNLTTNQYRLETTHLTMIQQAKEITVEASQDVDYLMKYRIFFTVPAGYKLNYRLLAMIKIALELNRRDLLEKIFSEKHHKVDQQLIIDALYLFGTIQQIITYYPIGWNHAPSLPVLSETICYGQINKLCFLFSKNLISVAHLKELYTVVTTLADAEWLQLFGKILPAEHLTKSLIHVVRSSNVEFIRDHLETNPNLEISREIIKLLLQLENLELVQKITIPTKYLPELLDWTREADLLGMHHYLASLGIAGQ